MDNSNELLKQITAEAIRFIKENEPPEGYFVGFSGGKDSIVTLDLVRKSGVKHQAYYAMTLIDPPEVVRFIKDNYPDVGRLIPKLTLWQGIMKNGPPYFHRRWCCKELKEKPAARIKLKNRILGIRAEESPGRAKRGRINKHKEFWHMHYYPIFEWSSADVWDYIRSEELKYPSLYDEGFSRLGCVVCMFITAKIKEKHKSRWPGHYRILEKYLNEYWNKNKEKMIDTMTYEDFMNWPRWKKTERIAVLKAKNSQMLKKIEVIFESIPAECLGR